MITITKIKRLITLTAAATLFLVPSFGPLLATASADNILTGVCRGVNNAANDNNKTNCGSAGSGSGATNLHKIATKIVDLFSIVVGIIAIVMVIYAGFKYITSGSDSGNVSGAKSTLIYALVGLVIVALAQFLVHFVLNTTSNTVSNNSAVLLNLPSFFL